MSIENYNSTKPQYMQDPETGTGYVWDPQNGVWDEVVPGVKHEIKKSHPLMKKAIKVMAGTALAATVAYGGVHAVGDFAGHKTGSGGMAEVDIPTMWNNIVDDLPERLRKGF